MAAPTADVGGDGEVEVLVLPGPGKEDVAVEGGGRAAEVDLEVLDADLAAFDEALRRENHTLKRSLTDPHVFSGISALLVCLPGQFAVSYSLVRGGCLLPKHEALNLATGRLGQAVHKLDLAGIGMGREALPHVVL